MKTSFEFFPPRTDKGKQTLAQVRQELSAINPEYFSVTFGAGGSTQDATLETVLDIQANDGVSAAPHLSCIGSEKAKIIELLDQYKAADINRLVTLRGDIPSGVRDIGDFVMPTNWLNLLSLSTITIFTLKWLPTQKCTHKPKISKPILSTSPIK